MKVQNIARSLKKGVYAALAVLLAIVLLGETGVLPNGVIEAKSMAEVVANTLAVLMMLASVPYAIKAFSDSVREKNTEADLLGLCFKRRMSGQVVLAASSIVCLVIYYITLNSTGAMCSLLSVAIMLWGFPTEDKLNKVMRKKEDEQ